MLFICSSKYFSAKATIVKSEACDYLQNSPKFQNLLQGASLKADPGLSIMGAVTTHWKGAPTYNLTKVSKNMHYWSNVESILSEEI